MNKTDCYVTEVIGEPYFAYGNWFVDVSYDSWGHKSKHMLMFSTKEEALKVAPGFHFLA